MYFGVQYEVGSSGSVKYFVAVPDVRYLIYKGGKYYGISQENYNSETQTYNPLTLAGSTPTKDDYLNFGFSEPSALTTAITIGSETFKPIDKFTTFTLKVYREK